MILMFDVRFDMLFLVALVALCHLQINNIKLRMSALINT